MANKEADSQAAKTARGERVDDLTGKDAVEAALSAVNENPEHPDEAVKPAEEVPSKLVAEAQLRHDNARGDLATPQEVKQAAVEQAHALSTRPDGSYAQLHETVIPTLAVGDEQEKEQLERQQDRAVEGLKGAAPVGSRAFGQQQDEAAKAVEADQAASGEQSGSAKAASGK